MNYFSVICLLTITSLAAFISADEVEQAQVELQAKYDEALVILQDLIDERNKRVEPFRGVIWNEHNQQLRNISNIRTTSSNNVKADRTKILTMLNTDAQDAGTKVLAEKRGDKKLDEFREQLKTFYEFLEQKVIEHEERTDQLANVWQSVAGIFEWIEKTRAEVNTLTTAEQKAERLKHDLHNITRIAQLAQFNEEEKVRSEGNSGLKIIRARKTGEKSYHTNTHTGRSIASIHDHSNNIRTVGMGEFIGVLNGVEFRTRHNDYRLSKPVENDKTLHKTVPVDFPEVPRTVTHNDDGSSKNVAAQVQEMREYFRAFKEQDTSIRDYKSYFKPVLCYLEGAWMHKDDDNVEEPFTSDRHKLDAKTWQELAEKIQYTSYTGTKSKNENLAHLPTTIMDFSEDGKPIYAQWNYRILCHPLAKDLPTGLFQAHKDYAALKYRDVTKEQFLNSRAARFDLFGVDDRGRRRDGPLSYSYMDLVMEEIPGKDNYGAQIQDQGFDSQIKSANPKRKGQQLNAAYYHRPYKLTAKDAMGVSSAQRGYSDIYYFAVTSQDKVAGPSVNDDKSKSGGRLSIKGSYLLPLEIIYLTPLSKWNPYNLAFTDDENSVKGKDGTINNPLPTLTPKNFYQTPTEFFTGYPNENDNADTDKGTVHVLTQSNEKVAVRGSGTRIIFPKIQGIDGVIRQRYPIVPIYGEGSSVWKKLNAIKDSINLADIATGRDKDYYTTSISEATYGVHSHAITFNTADLNDLKYKRLTSLFVRTEASNTHTHELVVKYNFDLKKYFIYKCDGAVEGADGKVCWDHHGIELKTSSV